MAKKPYDEVGVVRIVGNNKGCTIQGKTITVDDTKSTVGNSTWGKIDYLCKVHGYHYTIGKVEKHYTSDSTRKNKSFTKYQGNNKITDNNAIGKGKGKSTIMGNMARAAMKSTSAR